MVVDIVFLDNSDRELEHNFHLILIIFVTIDGVLISATGLWGVWMRLKDLYNDIMFVYYFGPMGFSAIMAIDAYKCIKKGEIYFWAKNVLSFYILNV